MRIPGKRYRTYTVHRDTWSASALSQLGVDHFGRYCTKIYGKQDSEKTGGFKEVCTRSSSRRRTFAKEDVYVNYGATEDIPEDTCSLRSCRDLTLLD